MTRTNPLTGGVGARDASHLNVGYICKITQVRHILMYVSNTTFINVTFRAFLITYAKELLVTFVVEICHCFYLVYWKGMQRMALSFMANWIWDSTTSCTGWALIPLELRVLLRSELLNAQMFFRSARTSWNTYVRPYVSKKNLDQLYSSIYIC